MKSNPNPNKLAILVRVREDASFYDAVDDEWGLIRLLQDLNLAIASGMGAWSFADPASLDRESMYAQIEKNGYEILGVYEPIKAVHEWSWKEASSDAYHQDTPYKIEQREATAALIKSITDDLKKRGLPESFSV